MQIDLVDEEAHITAKQTQLVTDIVQLAGKIEKVAEDSELSITVVRDAEIQEINNTYRGINAPTDVISFEMQEDVESIPAEIQQHVGSLLGDIIISIDRAREQANEYNHSIEREVGFLVVHGFLHLLGYTHDTEEEAKQMFAKQEEILRQYGLKRK